MQALNSDADKLLSEYGEDAIRDPDLRRLKEEMRQCNRIYADLSAQAKDKGELLSWYFEILFDGFK